MCQLEGEHIRILFLLFAFPRLSKETIREHIWTHRQKTDKNCWCTTFAPNLVKTSKSKNGFHPPYFKNYPKQYTVRTLMEDMKKKCEVDFDQQKDTGKTRRIKEYIRQQQTGVMKAYRLEWEKYVKQIQKYGKAKIATKHRKPHQTKTLGTKCECDKKFIAVVMLVVLVSLFIKSIQ